MAVVKVPIKYNWGVILWQIVGKIILNNREISSLKEEERAIYMGRVYQNPSMGVSLSLTILENMALADKKKGGKNLA